PAAGATGVPESTAIVLHLSRPLDRASAAGASVRLADKAGRTYGARVEPAADGRALVVRPERKLPAGATIEVAASGTLSDETGKPFAWPAPFAFTVRRPS